MARGYPGTYSDDVEVQLAEDDVGFQLLWVRINKGLHDVSPRVGTRAERGPPGLAEKDVQVQDLLGLFRSTQEASPIRAIRST